jgi:hypothetical protein
VRWSDCLNIKNADTPKCREYVGFPAASCVRRFHELTGTATAMASLKTKKPLPRKGFFRFLSLAFSRCQLLCIAEAAGIAPADAVPQVISAHATCVEHGCQFLRHGCADAALQELVANWHRLSPSVTEAVLALVRDG